MNDSNFITKQFYLPLNYTPFRNCFPAHSWKLALTIIIVLLGSFQTFAQLTFTGTGNFSDATKWTGGTLPTAGQNLIINGACTVDNAAGTDNIAYGTLTIGTATGRTLSWIAGGTNRLNVSNVNAGAGASALNMTNGGTLIIRGTWTSTNLTFTSGTGTIEMQSTITLPAAYATYYNLKINGGGQTVSAGVGTTVNNNLTITSGTFSVGAFSLAVTGSTSVKGIMNITSATGAKSFGDLVVNTGGTFTNTTAVVPITINGNLQNDGTFSQGTGRVTFTGAGSNTITGTAATTAFGGGITIDKGVVNTNVLDVQSVITMATGGLTLTNGTFKISSSSAITPFTIDIATLPYLIPATAGLWVNGATVSTTSNVTSAGQVHVSAGTLNIGNAPEVKFLPANGANIIIDGGILNVAGRFSYANAADVITFTMSSGTINVPSSGSTSAVASFSIINTGSSFTMSGGSIIIKKSGGSPSNAGYSNAAATSNVTGGTIQIGTATTPVNDTMSIYSVPPIGNLTINGVSSTVAQIITTALTVTGDVTITTGKFNSNNFDLTVGGDWINNSTFTPGTATVTFNGTTVMSGTTAINTFNNLTVAASSTVTSSAGLTGLVVNSALTTGASAILDLGTTTILSGTLGTISNAGTIKTSVPTTTSATPIPTGKTWGGTIDYYHASANQTVVGGTYNNLTVRPGNGRTATASGNLVVDGALFVTTAFGAFDLSTYVLSGILTSINNQGDIRTSVPTTTSATPLPAGETWNGTIYYNATTGAQTVVGGTYNIIRFSNTSGTNTASGDLTVNNQFVTTAGGTLDMGSLYRIVNMGSTITNNGTVKTSVLTSTSATPFANGKTWGGTGTVEYAATGGAQTVMSGTYNNLKLSNTSGTEAVSGNITVSGVFTLTGGTITTGANTIYLNSTGLVTRTSGHVIGNFQKYIATGATSKIFEIGDASNYTPVAITFASVTTAGNLTATVTATEHPNLAGSGIRTDRSVNRYFTFTNAGIVFTTATLTLNWVAGDVDAGSTTSSFVTGNYIASAWTLPTTASPLATSIQATGLTAISGDFAAGQLCTATTTSNAGADQTGATTCGLTTVTLAGNVPSVGIGAWSIISGTGGTVTTPSSATSTFSGTAASTYTLRWTISNTGCSTSTDDVIITFNRNPTTSNAGADQTGATTCGLTTVTLAANAPSIGTGAWSIVSGAGGSFGNATSTTSTFLGTAGTTYTLRWTISNSPCTSSADDVVITFNINPTTSNAGADQTGAATCGLTTVTLAGNTPSVGTGAWSIISGTGGTVTSISSPTSTFTGTAGSTYTLRWTTTNGSCTSADDVIITLTAAAGTPTAITGTPPTCQLINGTTTTAFATTSTNSSGFNWSISNPAAGTINSSTGVMTWSNGFSGSVNIQVTATGCSGPSAQVTRTVTITPTVGTPTALTVAGGTEPTCQILNTTTTTTYFSTATNSTSFNGSVSNPAAGATNSSTGVMTWSNGFSGSVNIQVTANGCNGPSPMTIRTVNVAQSPTISNAGVDQTGAATCGLTSVTLAGNTPTVGTGTWSIVSGTGGTIATPASATSTFSGTAGTTYTLRWTISNSGCTASTDDVIITFNRVPTNANAGPDQTSAATCGLTTVTLAGNAPSVGTGAWSIVSGTGGTVTIPSSATSTFLGTAGTTYTLRWTTSNSPCTSSTDDVVITFNIDPTTSNAGADQTDATTCGLTTVILAANVPSVGTGAWSIISGTGGTVNTPSSATSTFSGTAGTTYTLRWTISNAPCTASTDDVVITFNQLPAATISYSGTPFCTSPGTGQAVTQSGTTGGTYSSTAGLTINGATGTITPGTSTAGTYTVTYTMAAGSCAQQTATTSVTITAAPSATISYTGSPYCSSSGTASVTQSGTSGGIYSSTAGLTIDASTGAVTLASSTAGTYTVTYTIAAAAGCSLYATTTSITITTQPSTNGYYAGSPYCSNGGIAFPTGTFQGVPGTITSTAGLSIDASGVVTLGTSTPGTYTVDYTVPASGGCALYTYNSTITITALPAATISYSGTPFCKSIGTAQAVTQSGTTGGTYSSTAGLTINTTTGAITPGTSTAGTYTVTYTMAPTGGCAQQTATASVTITAAPTATISYAASPYCLNAGTASVTLSGTSGGTYSSTAGLSINAATGAVTLATSTSGTYTVTYTVIAAAGCSSYQTTASITITTPGTWTGTVSTDWNTSGNWSCGMIPTTTTNVTIPGGLTNYPLLNAGSGSVQDITIQTGASLTVTAAVLQIGGIISNSGTFTASSGTLEMNGAAAQTIPAAAFAGNTIKSLTVNNTAGLTLGGALNLTDALTMSGGMLNTGGYLTLKSTATTIARVAQITSLASTPISGNVIIERYVPGRRKYRLITSSVTTSNSASLSVGQEALSIWGNWQNQGNNVTSNTGTIITGGSSADGFDTQTGNASVFTYDDVNRKYVGYTTANGKNTKYTPLKAGVAYYLFVYGDRLNSIGTSTPNNTVLKEYGTLLTGDQLYTTSSTIPLSNVTNRYTLIGNPFASPIDWASLLKANLSNTYWGWDPNLSSTGGYVTVNTTGTVTLIAPFSGSTGLNQYIQPGQGFFVKTTGASPTLTIREQDKAQNFNPFAFRTTSGMKTTNTGSLMAINLQYVSGSSTVLADGVIAAFDEAFSNGAGEEDAAKMANTAEALSILNAGDTLSIDARQAPRVNDSILLNTARLTKAQYILQIFAQQMNDINVQPYLVDRYLNTTSYLSVSDTNRIVFNVNASVAASVAPNRFAIVFRAPVALPVVYTAVKAIPKNKNIEVSWKVATDAGVENYQVEKSADGIHFVIVATTPAHGNNSIEPYTWLDQNALTGNNYYRIRAIETGALDLLSKIVMVHISAGKTVVKIFPNPLVNGQATLVINSLKEGPYSFILVNLLGEQVMRKAFIHPGGVLNQTITLNRNIVAGVYYLHIQGGGNDIVQSIFVE